MDKKSLLDMQIQKINEVIDNLTNYFENDEFIDEVSYLSIVRDRLLDEATNNL